MRTSFSIVLVFIAQGAFAQPASTSSRQAASTGAGMPYPIKPVRVIVPSQAGGGADIVARAIAYKMSEAFGQQVVVDNRIGVVGAEIVAKSAADGYTLMFTTSALAVREAVYRNLPFNTLRDFQPVNS